MQVVVFEEEPDFDCHVERKFKATLPDGTLDKKRAHWIPSPLHEAARAGNLDAVTDLLDESNSRKADVKEPDKVGWLAGWSCVTQAPGGSDGRTTRHLSTGLRRVQSYM